MTDAITKIKVIENGVEKEVPIGVSEPIQAELNKKTNKEDTIKKITYDDDNIVNIMYDLYLKYKNGEIDNLCIVQTPYKQFIAYIYILDSYYVSIKIYDLESHFMYYCNFEGIITSSNKIKSLVKQLSFIEDLVNIRTSEVLDYDYLGETGDINNNIVDPSLEDAYYLNAYMSGGLIDIHKPFNLTFTNKSYADMELTFNFLPYIENGLLRFKISMVYDSVHVSDKSWSDYLESYTISNVEDSVFFFNFEMLLADFDFGWASHHHQDLVISIEGSMFNDLSSKDPSLFDEM